MNRVRILMIALTCLGLGSLLSPFSSPTASRAQPPQKGDHAPQTKAEQTAKAVQRIAELRAKLDKINRELNDLRGLHTEEKKEADKDDGTPKVKVDESPKAKEQAKADFEKSLVRAKALATEREVTVALLMDALKEAPNATTRQENLSIMGMLNQTIETKALQEKVKLKTALEFFADQFAGKLPILVDREAFFPVLGPEAPDPYEEEVSLPPVPAKMRMGVALRLVLSQVGKGEATFTIRQGHIEITTLKASTAANALIGSTVLSSFDQRPLHEVLEELADQTGLEIQLDPNIGKKNAALIKATFRNTSLEDALVTVTEMAELKFVVLDRSVYVTTPEKAEILRREQKKRDQKREKIRATPKQSEPAK
jgi:hypothetical protein